MKKHKTFCNPIDTANLSREVLHRHEKSNDFAENRGAHTCVESTLYPYHTPGKNNLGEKSGSSRAEWRQHFSSFPVTGCFISSAALTLSHTHTLPFYVCVFLFTFVRITLTSILSLPAGHCIHNSVYYMYVCSPRELKIQRIILNENTRKNKIA